MKNCLTTKAIGKTEENNETITVIGYFNKSIIYPSIYHSDLEIFSKSVLFSVVL